MPSTPCPHCGESIPQGSKVCWKCLEPIRGGTDTAPPPPAANRVSRPRAENWWGLVVLRLAYVAYGALYLWTLADSMPEGLEGTQLVAHLFMPALTLLFVVIALLRVKKDPFIWSLSLASFQTLDAINAQLADRPNGVMLVVAGVLWIIALSAPRIERGLAGRGLDHKFDADDRRIVFVVLFIYVGTIVALLGTFQFRLLYYPAMFAVMFAALRILGGWWGDVMPFGLSVKGLGLAIAGAVAYVGLVLVFFALQQGWWPDSIALGPVSGGLFFMHALLPAVLEETLCRGLLWQAVRERAGRMGTIVVTATLFGLLHGVGGSSAGGLPVQFLAGVILGFVRAWTGSLAPCMLAHAATNALLISLATGSE